MLVVVAMVLIFAAPLLTILAVSVGVLRAHLANAETVL